jgi:hypothetical protein
VVLKTTEQIKPPPLTVTFFQVYGWEGMGEDCPNAMAWLKAMPRAAAKILDGDRGLILINSLLVELQA